MGKELSNKELKFCKAYAKDPERNATKAAIAAGYSDGAARQQGYRLLQKDYIKQKIDDILKPIAEKIEEQFNYTALESFKNLCKAQEIALAQTQYYPATKEVRAKPDLPAFLKAEELKMKLAGLFEEKENKPQDVIITVKTSADIITEQKK
jgi:phage terminase small subunit